MRSVVTFTKPATGPMIALLAALPEEVSGLRRKMALPRVSIGATCTGEYGGRPLLLARMGMGRQRAEAAAEAVLARFPVSTVISIGFSGALDRQLDVGDLVLASQLVGIAGPGGGEIEPTTYHVSQELLHAVSAALEDTCLRVIVGPTVTTPFILDTQAGRRQLSQRTGAVAVDMESYWIARVASDRGVPFLAVRAISDAEDDYLPPLDQILFVDGTLNAGRLAAYLLRGPDSVAVLVRLSRDARRARRALTTAATRLVTVL